VKNNNKLIGSAVTLAIGSCLLLGVSMSARASETHDNYAFMSAQDLFDALSQQSQVALGYLLGIVDARKGPQPDGGCFTVPWQSDADEVLVTAYLEYWPQVADFSKKAPDALTQMMRERFPCQPKN
jgi:hypothetical protein